MSRCEVALGRSRLRRRPAPAAARRRAHRRLAAQDVRGDAGESHGSHVRRKTADQRQPRCARARPGAPPTRSICAAASRMSSMPAASHRLRMLDHERRKRAEVARRRLRSAAHDGVRDRAGTARTAAVEQRRSRRRVRHAPTSTRRRASQPSQAPLPSSEIGSPQPPTRCCRPFSSAQPMLPVPTTMTPPSRPPMRADAGRVRVGRENGVAERMLARSRRRQLGRLARARERKAGGDPRTGPGERPACCRHCRVAVKDCRKGSARSPKRMLAGPATASPSWSPDGAHRRAAAAGSAAVNAEKRAYPLSQVLPQRSSKVNAPERFRIEHVVVPEEMQVPA